MDDVIGCLQRGEMQAFYNDRGVILTSLVQSPQRRYVEIFLSAGDMDAVMALFPQVEEWARENDADFGRAMVRPGFEPIFKKLGWKKKTVVMEYYLKG